MNYDAITNMAMSFGDGGENPSGIAEIGYFIPLSWLQTIQKPAGVTAEGLVQITTAHVLKAGKAPIAVTPMFEKSGINWKLAGEQLSKIFDTGAEVFVPNNSAAVLGTAGAIKNYRGIWLFGKADGSGQFWQVGSEALSAKVVDIAGGTGVGPTGEVGSKATIQAYGTMPVYSYEAELPAPAAP